jgi:phage shock protein A
MMEPKTDVKVRLTGTDGNVFALASKVSSALKKGGYPDLAREFVEEVFQAESYNKALQLMMQYVRVS